MDLYNFAAHIERSDGILNVLDFGFDPQGVPEGPLREMWQRATDAYREHLEPVVGEISDYLDTVIPAYGAPGHEQYAAIRDGQAAPAPTRPRADPSYTCRVVRRARRPRR